MKKSVQERINFIEHLHEIFYIKKGYGAYAFISVSDAMSLFDKYSATDKSADLFINQYVRSL
jgi:hypothetical protein